MKLLGAKVDWMEKWGNDPYWLLIVDKLPEREDLRFTRFGDGYYVAQEASGYVSMIFKSDPKIRDDGFGGAKQHLTLSDGSVLEFFGGWHTSVRRLRETPEWGTSALLPFTDVTFIERNGRYGNLRFAAFGTLALIQQAIDSYLPGIEIYNGDYGFVPKRVGQPPKHERTGKNSSGYAPLSSEQEFGVEA